MKYREHPPHSSLHDYVKCFWILEKEYTAEEPYEEVTPDACIELIFNFGARYALQTKGLDCLGDYNRMNALGVKFHRQPESGSWGIGVLLEDLYGNKIFMSQEP